MKNYSFKEAKPFIEFIDKDSGKTLCICGADAISDGYAVIWCE